MNCPKQFCFHWKGIGDRKLPFHFQNIDEALKHIDKATPSSEERCGCIFGSCIRLDSNSTIDWYEPNEPTLEKSGLPEDFFI